MHSVPLITRRVTITRLIANHIHGRIRSSREDSFITGRFVHHGKIRSSRGRFAFTDKTHSSRIGLVRYQTSHAHRRYPNRIFTHSVGLYPVKVSLDSHHSSSSSRHRCRKYPPPSSTKVRIRFAMTKFLSLRVHTILTTLQGTSR